MTGKQAFYNLVDEGREGHNIGLSVGLKKLDWFIDGWLPGTSYLLGGGSGTGKSTLALYLFISTCKSAFTTSLIPFLL